MANQDFVTVNILDLPGAGGGCPCSDPTPTTEYATMLQQKVAELQAALEESYPGPLVVIDGTPRFAGSIQVQKIVKEVGDLMG